MKILSVVGTRPNFIKMAPVIREISSRKIPHVLVHTGQHYDRELSEIFIKELKMPKPDYFLDVGSGSHGYQIGEMLKKIEKVILKEGPDFVMIPGDTNTSLAGALASSKITGVRTCHIEAGLRSFDRRMPEEINRILIDHCSDFLFCPTETAEKNLQKEGISQGMIHRVGDTMYDACLEHLNLAKQSGVSQKYKFNNDYFLVTVHRAENTDDRKRLEGIINALLEIKQNLLFPIHPRTKKQLMKYGLWEIVENSEMIQLMEPIGYLEFLFLLSNAKLMITDSGGVQKEAFLLKVPCITLRDNTEWVETVYANANMLVGADKKAIFDGIDKMVKTKVEYKTTPFGDGKAARKVVDIIAEEED